MGMKTSVSSAGVLQASAGAAMLRVVGVEVGWGPCPTLLVWSLFCVSASDLGPIVIGQTNPLTGSAAMYGLPRAFLWDRELFLCCKLFVEHMLLVSTEMKATFLKWQKHLKNI